MILPFYSNKAFIIEYTTYGDIMWAIKDNIRVSITFFDKEKIGTIEIYEL